MHELVVVSHEFEGVLSKLTIDVGGDDCSCHNQKASHSEFSWCSWGYVYHCEYQCRVIQHLQIDEQPRPAFVPNVCLNGSIVSRGDPDAGIVDCYVDNASLDVHEQEEHKDDYNSSQLCFRLFTRMHVGDHLINFPESHQFENPQNAELLFKNFVKYFERGYYIDQCLRDEHDTRQGREEVEDENIRHIARTDLPGIVNCVTCACVNVGSQEANHDVYDEDEVNEDI